MDYYFFYLKNWLWLFGTNKKDGIRKDILGKLPGINDTIVFNPAAYKGLAYGKVVGFTRVGLPILELDKKFANTYIGQRNKDGTYSPKTGFVIVKD